MQLIQCYMRQSTWYKGAGTGTPKGVLWHSTGADNPYISRYVQPDDDAADREEMIALLGKNKYNNDWNHITRDAGVNAFIGKLTDGSIATVETGPHTMKAWGVGDDADKLKNGWSLNSTHLQFEICEDGLDDKAYFEKVYQEASEYTAMICEEFGLDPLGTFVYKGDTIPVITDHAGSHAIGHGGNHGDVGHWFRKYLGSDYMDDIRKNVKRIMDEHKTEEAPEKPTEPAQPEKPIEAITYYRVQIGAYTAKNNAEKQLAKAKDAGFSAFIVQEGKHYKVQIGAYTVKANAERQLAKVVDAGFNAFITVFVKETQPAPEAPEKPAPVEPKPEPQPSKKSNEELAQEVLQGKWGNGADRKNRLTDAGYDYNAVQAIVNELCKPKNELKIGDKVKMKEGAIVYGSTSKYQAWVYKSTLYVRSISGDRIVVSTYKDPGTPVTGPVDKQYLTKV